MKRLLASVLLLLGGVTSAEAAPTFTTVTAESGLQAIRDSKPADFWMSGLSLVDLDHDGDLDLFLADHHGQALAALNDGSGHFSVAAGTYPTTEIHMCLDVDEDGKVDVDATYSDGGAKWWLNQTTAGSPALKFTDVGDVDTRQGNESREEALVDLDRDGKLDWVRSCQGQNFKVDFGDGAGHFSEDSALIAQPAGNALDAGVMFADLDGDGDEDMVINWGGYDAPGGDDYGRLRVLVNDGKMNLLEKTSEMGLVTEHLAILGVGDVDQDGDIDLIGLLDRKFPEVIYANDGHGFFSALPAAVTGVSGSAQYALWGLATVTDLDNDGVADILIDGRVFFHVLRGTGGGHFAYQNEAWGKITHIAEASVDGGFAFGDIDADGDLDLLGFTAGDPNRQIALYRNDLPARHWLNVRPVGLPGNKAGVSSKIRVYEANTDHLLWYEEALVFSKQAQQNYYAFDALERHYGLGEHDTVDVTIAFYPSGTVVRKNGVAADTTIVLGEDGTNGVVEPPAPKMGTGGTASQPDPSGAGAGGSGARSSVGGAGSGAVGANASGGSSTAGANASGGSSTAGANASGGSGTAGANTLGGSSMVGSSSGAAGGCACGVGVHGGKAQKHVAIGLALTLLVFFRRRRSAIDGTCRTPYKN